jgi:transcriptional antiterminator NusG
MEDAEDRVEPQADERGPAPAEEAGEAALPGGEAVALAEGGIEADSADPTPESESAADDLEAPDSEAREEPVSEPPLMFAEESEPAEPEAAAASGAEEPVVEDVVEPGEEPGEEPDDGRRWYVVHCYSGYESKVRHNLEQRVETMGMKGKIFDVVVPTEEEIEVKEGKRRTVERHVFPGYILVQMLMDEDSWYVVRNTPGVTGFVGMGNEPTPLRPEEVQQIIRRMEAEAPRVKVTYKTGQRVRIIDGPFNDFIGTVDEIDMDRAKVRVMVSFFGRETPVELDFLQVEKA